MIGGREFFWQFNGYAMVPAFTLDNYRGILTSDVTLKTYLNTFKFVVLVWFFFTLIIGYPVAYFLFISCQRATVAGDFISGVHHSILDI